jgi:hypothetical protein
MNIEIVTNEMKPIKPLIPLNISGLKYLVLHHVEADNYNWQQCNRDHKANGWDCGGYNEMIMKSGKVIIMRGDNIGAHCQGANSISYGIAVEGNYNNFNVMPPEQYNSLMERINFNLKRFPKVTIVPHSQLFPTECPGKFFPLVRVLSDVNVSDLELAAALAILKTDGAINSPNYWQTNAKTGGKCDGSYVRQLILNMVKTYKE